MRMQRAMGSAEYRDCSTDHERLHCLLFTFSIPPPVIFKETKYTRNQVYYFLKKGGDVRENRGRPSLLEDKEVEAVKIELRQRAQTMKPATRKELIQIVRLNYLNMMII